MNKVTDGNLIVRRIDTLLYERKDNRANLCRALNLKHNTISNWLTRGTLPKVEDALRIAEYLNVSVEWLVYGEDNSGISMEERELLADWKLLSETEKQSIRILIDGFKKAKSSVQADKA